MHAKTHEWVFIRVDSWFKCCVRPCVSVVQKLFHISVKPDALKRLSGLHSGVGWISEDP